MHIEAKFHQELLPGEKFLWTGQPDQNMLFAKGDMFLIPFSLIWGGGMMFAILPGFLTSGAPSAFSLFPLIFVVVGAYMIFGRFIYKYLKKKNTYYAVTNERVLILTELLGRNLQAINAKTVSAINKTVNANGSGSIVFGEQNQQAAMYGNMGMDLFAGGTVPAFYDIHQVDEVYEKINRIKN